MELSASEKRLSELADVWGEIPSLLRKIPDLLRYKEAFFETCDFQPGDEVFIHKSFDRSVACGRWGTQSYMIKGGSLGMVDRIEYNKDGQWQVSFQPHTYPSHIFGGIPIRYLRHVNWTKKRNAKQPKPTGRVRSGV